MWENEKSFGNSLKLILKKEGFACNRIETHGTLNGMPDMFVQGNGIDTFIELKNMKNASVNDKQWKVPWRPGQLAWAAVYRNSHLQSAGDFDIVKCSWTFIGCRDGIIAVPMLSNFLLNTVIAHKDLAYVIRKGDKIRDILRAHSQLVMPAMCPGERRMYDFVCDIARCYQYTFAGPAEADIDWPCTEIIAQSAGVSVDELKGRAPAEYRDCRALSANIATVIYSCYSSWLLNK